MNFKFILTLLICSLWYSVSAQLVNITFQVDMSNSGLTPTVVSIGGGFQGWAPEAGALTDIGNGIWERTYSIQSNTNIQFKFTAGANWDLVEQVPSECGVSDGFGSFNRTLQIGNIDGTYGPVCYSSCLACEEVELVPVTFRVDMSNETVGPNGVHVAGTFQNWNPATSELLPVGFGVYEGTFGIASNSTAYFKFINGNDWPGQEAVPADCGNPDGFGSFNRFIEVGTESSSYTEVCFEGCYSCDEVIPVLVTFQVDMSNEIVDPLGVFITGSFNDFDAADIQMSQGLDNVYEAVLVLNPGETIQYKFLNGPSFDGQESVPSECGIDDGFGSFNRSHSVEASPETLPALCFSSCAACPTIETYLLTLGVDMNDEVPNVDGVYVAGTFNDFNASAHQMIESDPGIYEITIEVTANENILYKFLNGPSFDFEEEVPVDCGVDDGFGGFNRSILVDSDISADLVCFSTCTICLVQVDEIALQEIRLSPNPTNGIINLQTENTIERLTLIDMNGRLIASFYNLRNGDQLDLSSFDSGVYLLQSTGFKPSRIIIE